MDLASVTPIALNITGPASASAGAAAPAASGVVIPADNAGSPTWSLLLTAGLATIRLAMDTHFPGTVAATQVVNP